MKLQDISFWKNSLTNVRYLAVFCVLYGHFLWWLCS